MKRFTKISKDGVIETVEGIVKSKHGQDLLRERAVKELGEMGYFFIKDTKTFNNLVNSLINSYYRNKPLKLVPFGVYVKRMNAKNEAIY